MSNRIKEEFIQKKDPVRLNKYLSEAGVCSRREADRLIEAGKVTVDGKTAQTGMRVTPGQTVKVGSKVVSRQEDMIVLAVNKPKGIVCTEEKRERNSIVRFLDYPVRVTYAGRLDKDTEGLLLLTDDGPLGHDLLSPSKHVDKVYYAQVEGTVDAADVEALAQGMVLGDGLACLPAGLEPLGDGSECLVTLREGKYHQVKRMLAARGKPVRYLKRLSMGPIRLDPALGPGEWRPLTREEIAAVRTER